MTAYIVFYDMINKYLYEMDQLVSSANTTGMEKDELMEKAYDIMDEIQENIPIEISIVMEVIEKIEESGYGENIEEIINALMTLDKECLLK